MQSVHRDNQSITTDPGLSAALARDLRGSVPTEKFKKLGIRVLGENLCPAGETSAPIQLTAQHYDFVNSLPRAERRHYRVVVVPGSASRSFFRDLYAQHHRHVNQGDWAVAPVTPQQAYVQLIRLPREDEPQKTPLLCERDASPQTLIIGELSARLGRGTLLPTPNSFLESALCQAAGPSRSKGVRYLVGQSVDGLLHVVIDDGAVRGVTPVKALECTIPL
jgi:hypothetical protein